MNRYGVLQRAMVIRRMDAEAGADPDAEMQITIDFGAEGSSQEAARTQVRSNQQANRRNYGSAGTQMWKQFLSLRLKVASKL